MLHDGNLEIDLEKFYAPIDTTLFARERAERKDL
jgi:hypothetical protein